MRMAPLRTALRRATILLGIGFTAGLVATSPAWATTPSTDIHLNPGQKGKTATSFENNCDQVPGGRRAGYDGWVFVLPGNAGTLVSLDITFRTGTATVHVRIPDPASPYPNGIATNGSDKGYVVVPAGWTVVDGTGQARNPQRDTFNVTHVCRGGGSPEEKPGKPGKPDKPGKPGAPGSPSSPPGESPAGGSSGPGGSAAGAGGESLPITGTAVGGLVALGLGLVGVGGALLVLRRRRGTIRFQA
jgi:LPXTG-motif cell wall-anchored protein